MSDTTAILIAVVLLAGNAFFVGAEEDVLDPPLPPGGALVGQPHFEMCDWALLWA